MSIAPSAAVIKLLTSAIYHNRIEAAICPGNAIVNLVCSWCNGLDTSKQFCITFSLVFSPTELSSFNPNANFLISSETALGVNTAKVSMIFLLSNTLVCKGFISSLSIMLDLSYLTLLSFVNRSIRFFPNMGLLSHLSLFTIFRKFSMSTVPSSFCLLEYLKY